MEEICGSGKLINITVVRALNDDSKTRNCCQSIVAMLNLTTPLFNPVAIALMIDLHGLFAAVIAIALIGVSVLVALILLITGVVHQKKHGLSFTQQKRFGYFLGAWVSSLFCFFV